MEFEVDMTTAGVVLWYLLKAPLRVAWLIERAC